MQFSVFSQKKLLFIRVQCSKEKIISSPAISSKVHQFDGEGEEEGREEVEVQWQEEEIGAPVHCTSSISILPTPWGIQEGRSSVRALCNLSLLNEKFSSLIAPLAPLFVPN